MPTYKLYYFNGRGRAECCRLLFAVAGVPYEDIRIEGDWATRKSEFKFQQVPEIDIDGKRFGQSRAIMFHLAREFGLYPTNNLEQIAVDEVIFLLDDLINGLVKAMFAKEEDKERLIKEFKEGQLEKSLGHLEKCCKNNDGGKSFMVGKKMTVADIALYDTLSGLTTRFEGCLDKYPCIKGVVGRVGDVDAIKKWVEKRPVTTF